MKVLLLLLGSLTLVLAQKFSQVSPSETIFLDTGESVNEGVFLDERALLVWQNGKKIPKLNAIEKARKYCETLNLYDYQWRLPTVWELSTLTVKNLKSAMNPAITYGRKKSYLAADAPNWDNELHFGFNYANHSTLVFEKNSEALSIRCVSSLE